MNSAQLLSRPDSAPRPGAATKASSEQPARISFRQPVATSGYIDAAWWPRSLDLTTELPPVMEVLWTAAREISRITYHIGAWDPAPRRMRIEGRTLRLGGFTTSDPLTVSLTDAWGAERIDVLVIAPSTDPEVAQRALLLASQAGSPYQAQEIMTKAEHADDGSVPRPA